MMTAATVSAAFSAIAALAACAAVILDIWKNRRARSPQLLGMPTSPTIGAYAGRLGITVRNVGPGPAIAPACYVVHDAKEHGAGVAAVLGPGEENTVYMDAASPKMGTVVPAIVWCRSVDGRVHWWTSDERHFVARVGGFPWPFRRRFSAWPKPPQMFGAAYPKVAPLRGGGAPGGAHPPEKS
jgi:hypothetical protein